MDCVTGSPMADTCVRQVGPGRWRGEVSARHSAGNCFTRRTGGEVEKGRGDVSTGVLCGGGLVGGEAGDIATEPRTIDTIAALPAGLSVSGRVGEGASEGPARVQVVINSLEERSATTRRGRVSGGDVSGGAPARWGVGGGGEGGAHRH